MKKHVSRETYMFYIVSAALAKLKSLPAGTYGVWTAAIPIVNFENNRDAKV